MRSSISPPYPKDLQILHDFNYVDPISPVFDKKIDILKKKTFNANEVLLNHKNYLENLKEAYQVEKNKDNLFWEAKRLADDKIQAENTKETAKNLNDTAIKASRGAAYIYKSLWNALVKAFDMFLSIVNGNIGAIILGIIAFIVFLILVLWMFGIISFPSEKSSNNKSITTSYDIPNQSELNPNGGKNDEKTFSFDDFLKSDNKLDYTTENINKYLKNELSNSQAAQKILDNYSYLKDTASNTLAKYSVINNETIQEVPKKVYVYKYHHFHDEIYLPIKSKKQRALFKPKNISITSSNDPRYVDYKFLISKITNYSIDDFSKIKIIFNESCDNIDINGFLLIDKIVSINDEKIIFYDSSKQENIITVAYKNDDVKDSVDGKELDGINIDIKFNPLLFEKIKEKI